MHRSSVNERRSFPRHTPVHALAWIAYAEANGDCVGRARLQDISVGGARLIVEGSIPATDSVWVTLAGVNSVEWVKASIVHVDAGDGGMVHLQFVDECPFELFRAAVLGAEDAEGSAEKSAAQPPPFEARAELQHSK
jgi:PilZ domain